jgi:hypothetical protein
MIQEYKSSTFTSSRIVLTDTIGVHLNILEKTDSDILCAVQLRQNAAQSNKWMGIQQWWACYGFNYTQGNKQLRIDIHSAHDHIRYESATIAVHFYLARMGTPQAAPACFPSANTRLPLTNVERTWPESSFPRYAEIFCKQNAKSVSFQFRL